MQKQPIHTYTTFHMTVVVQDTKKHEDTKELTIEEMMLRVSVRSSAINRYDRLTGDSVTKIVETLHMASQTNNPWVHCKHLLDKAGSTSSRVRDLFKSKTGWQKLILSDGKGRYRINL